MPEFKQRFPDFSLNEIWNLKMDESGIVGTVKAQQDYTLMVKVNLHNQVIKDTSM